ncbi:MAG: InlB B-repeat-containing protein, partial [Eubacteriales bacterium]|nr:InlB B-repeat-containing protein [Eubacteriales bacterium]
DLPVEEESGDSEEDLPTEALDEEGSSETTEIQNEDVPEVSDTEETYLANYLNADGIVEYTKTYEEGAEVDLGVRLGGGEKQLGWSLENGGEILSSYVMEAKDVSLYPVLDERTASYTIYFELENPETGKFDLADSETVSGGELVGTSVSADTVQASEHAKTYDGYTYSSADSTGEQVIENGTNAEVHVRFKANSYTLVFDLNGNKNSVSALYYSTLKMNVGGTEYRGSQYSVTISSGADCSAVWPTADNIVDNPYLATQYSDYFRGWTDGNGTLYTSGETFMNALPSLAQAGESVTLHGNWAGASDSTEAPEVTIKYHIYQQNPAKDGYEFLETVEKTAKATALTTVSLEPYEGFTYSRVEPVGTITTLKYGPWYAETKVQYYEENNVYFDRNSYELIFKSNKETVKSETVVYGASLADFGTYEPENKPAGRSYLEGWKDADGELFDFESTMPAENVTLTASWKYGTLETKKLVYDANGGEGSIPEVSVAAERMVRIADGTALQRAGYTFTEWNTEANGSGTAYSTGELLTLSEDTTLFAIWEVNKYQLAYDTAGGVWSDGYSDLYVEEASVLEALVITEAPEREGYRFTGWVLLRTRAAEGKTFQPGDVYDVQVNGFYVTGVFRAAWEKTEPSDDDNGNDTPADDDNGNDTPA